MARRKRWAEDMTARFQAGTFKRIEVVLDQDEDRTDFVRAAVERELQRREREGGPGAASTTPGPHRRRRHGAKG